MKTCNTCKYYKRGGFLDIRGSLCLHEVCIEDGFTHTDYETGGVSEWPSRPMTTYIARALPCGSVGRLWEPK